MSEGSTKKQGRGKALILTVGQGAVDDLEGTLISPFRKSFEAGEWQRILLLPSKETEANAGLLEQRFSQFPLKVCALQNPGDEDDTDACFRHFDEVIQRLLSEGFEADDCTADVTRGTKAMTAGLAMAAMAHRLGCIRYISGKREGGIVTPGSEIPKDVRPAHALRRLDVHRAIDFLKAGNYRAVEALFPGGADVVYGGHLKEEVRFLAWAAKFWGAWDRFDYISAQGYLNKRKNNLPTSTPELAQPFLPSEEQARALRSLAGKAAPDADDDAAYCRALAADLLANAERRLAEGQNEEVLVRLYRVLELMAQLRLFEHGIDTESVDLNHPRVAQWVEEEKVPLQPNSRGRCPLAREKAAELLLYLESRAGDETGIAIAKKLKNFKWLGDWGPKMRNRSVLIHGFRARSRGRDRELRDVMEKIRRFFFQEHPENQQCYDHCQFGFLELDQRGLRS
ncbi:MAG: TIGR02710 family CRISPR-associated CARF protein [Bryobacteraceae bacterium]